MPTCNVSLLRQKSRVPCVAEHHFGWNETTRKMWMRGGCRGVFKCCGYEIGCGFSGQSDGVRACGCLPDDDDPAPPLPRPVCASTTRRHAHVISTSQRLFERAQTHLVEAAGFSEVHHIEPIPTTDRRVLEYERAFRTQRDAHRVGSPLAHICVMLTHASIWKQPAVISGDWIYVFEDDARFDLLALQRYAFSASMALAETGVPTR